MKIKNFIIIFLSFFFCDSFAKQEHELRTEKQFLQFVQAQKNGSLLDYESMVAIFSDDTMSYKKLLKSIKIDIKLCRSWMKKSVEKDYYQQLLQQLHSFYNYVYTYQECCRAIQFHAQIRKKYALAFDDVNIVQAIETQPDLYGLQRYKYKSRAYFNQIVADLSQIDTFEDTIHADFSVLKAHNYVLKIELIKMRNNIYHHNLYKYQTRYF